MNKMYIAKLMYHKWEEEPISGIESGHSGTFAIFFYSCNMRCVYCQNSKISHIDYMKLLNGNYSFDSNKKIIYTADELSDAMIEAEKENAATISFITGALYISQIVDTIKLARKKGLTIPIVYNSSGYETVSQLKKLDTLIDIYLPDLKYADNSLGLKYSRVPNYFDIAKLAISEMYRQMSQNKNHTMIVRHLVLPNNTNNSKNAIKYLYDTYGDDICISIMSQYTPILTNIGLDDFEELRRRVTKREYEKVVDYVLDLGVKNALIQDMDTANPCFIPDF